MIMYFEVYINWNHVTCWCSQYFFVPFLRHPSFVLQNKDEKNQILTTNVWLNLVSFRSQAWRLRCSVFRNLDFDPTWQMSLALTQHMIFFLISQSSLIPHPFERNDYGRRERSGGAASAADLSHGDSVLINLLLTISYTIIYLECVSGDTRPMLCLKRMRGWSVSRVALPPSNVYPEGVA